MTPSIDRRLLLVAFMAAALLGERVAGACGPPPPSTEEVTTFDPDVTPSGLPPSIGVDEPWGKLDLHCASCAEDEMRADWGSYLGGAVDNEEWLRVLLKADLSELDALIVHLQKGTPTTSPYKSVLNVKAADKDKVKAALFFVGFARRVEPFAQPPPDDGTRQPPDEAALKKLIDGGSAALNRAPTPFLKQRYAFQLLRLRFYAHDWKGAAAFFDANAGLLEEPSTSLKWRAHSYLAGALLNIEQRARGDVELARVAAAFPPLAQASENAFAPASDKEWQQALALATTTKEKVALWRLVGRHDPIAALEQIAALDAGAPDLASLAARALVHIEYDDPEAKSPDMERLRQLVLHAAAKPGADHPWLLTLLAAHISALRGQTAEALAALEQVKKANPTGLVTMQVNATRALALAASIQKNPATGDEIARLVEGLDAKVFNRKQAVIDRVRSILQRSADESGKALLVQHDGPLTPEVLRTMIARIRMAKTPFEKFVVNGANLQELQVALAQALIARGRFTEAQQDLPAESIALNADPFLPWIKDCHDCDDPPEARKWTLQSFTKRLVELDRLSKGMDGAAARASFELGTALYAVSNWGRDTFYGYGASPDTLAAQAAFARAYELGKDPELRVQAAFMAAKCELAQEVERVGSRRQYMEKLPIPKKWFPIVRQYQDTQYYSQILAECGHYQRWAERGAAH